MKKIIMSMGTLLLATHCLQAINEDTLDTIQDVIEAKNQIVMSIPEAQELVDELNTYKEQLKEIVDTTEETLEEVKKTEPAHIISQKFQQAVKFLQEKARMLKEKILAVRDKLQLVVMGHIKERARYYENKLQELLKKAKSSKRKELEDFIKENDILKQNNINV